MESWDPKRLQDIEGHLLIPINDSMMLGYHQSSCSFERGWRSLKLILHLRSMQAKIKITDHLEWSRSQKRLRSLVMIFHIKIKDCDLDPSLLGHYGWFQILTILIDVWTVKWRVMTFGGGAFRTQSSPYREEWRSDAGPGQQYGTRPVLTNPCMNFI